MKPPESRRHYSMGARGSRWKIEGPEASYFAPEGHTGTITDDRRRREAILDRWALTLDATLTGRTP